MKYNSAQLASNKSKLKSTDKPHTEDNQTHSKTHYISLMQSGLKTLSIIEPYFAYPGLEVLKQLSRHLKQEEYKTLHRTINELNRMIMSDDFKQIKSELKEDSQTKKNKPRYFETLFVENLSINEEQEFKEKFLSIRSSKDDFIYQLVVAKSFQDALIALLFNPNIQACVIRYGISYPSKNINSVIKPFIDTIQQFHYPNESEQNLGVILGSVIKKIRPELDIYYVTDTPVIHLSDDVLQFFNRIFYRMEDLQELHLSIIQGIKVRYETPFYTALKDYSQKPTGVFHAMPVSRGNSVFKSNWIDDFGEFYGRNLFLAETSSTTGGLDSLLQPTGPLKKALRLAAKAFNSRHTFFATNGTSTSNKIVLQALIEPDDIVLIDRDCHKSHHYGMVLSGANVVYLDSYPVQEYSMYGAVPLTTIKKRLDDIKKAGRLDKVKMLLLTNCTFDGVVYNIERIMEEVLAIKPDMVFLWDEAWFAFAAFTPAYRQRTAMFVANKLAEKYKTEAYKKEYKNKFAAYQKSGSTEPFALPDPDKVSIRVYATQSTHKTLSSFRQGSMIHIWDEDYERKTEDSFHEVYMTHTSTSANYQILASLDVGRRQVSFEGYELVEKSIEMAMLLRAKINDHPDLKKYFDVLTIKDFIPNEYRQTGQNEYYNKKEGWRRLENAWANDEFVLDPTKINLFIGKTGMDGDTFKNKYLMDLFNIQINKTSRNTVLFMTNIGTTRSSVSYLLSVLLKISKQLDQKMHSLNKAEKTIADNNIYSLTNETPPLPHFSYYHDAFKALPGTPGGKLRDAYFLAYKENVCEYIRLEDCKKVLESGREIVSASFVIPYPPGFPVLVPGQVLNENILTFLLALDVKEIHGFRPELGLRIFTEEALQSQSDKTKHKNLPIPANTAISKNGKSSVQKKIAIN